jgi:microcompartment protein CcmL/EutN
MNALGIIEVSGMVAAYEAIDAMVKVADVTVLTWEKKLGGRLVSIVVQGDISSVHAAIAHGETIANQITKTVATALINNPHEEVIKIIKESASKYAFSNQELT